jgi:hypothetical protein
MCTLHRLGRLRRVRERLGTCNAQLDVVMAKLTAAEALEADFRSIRADLDASFRALG